MNKKKFNKEEFFFTVLFIIVALILLIISLYKIIKIKSLDAASSETTILFLISLVYIFYKFLKDKDFRPTTLKGDNLPIKQTKKDKQKRFKNYLLESLIFSVIIVCLDLLAILFLKDHNNIFNLNSNSTINIILNSLITFGICFIVSLGLESLIGEISIKKISTK